MPTKMSLEAFDSLSLMVPSIANFIGMGPLQLHKVLNLALWFILCRYHLVIINDTGTHSSCILRKIGP